MQSTRRREAFRGLTDYGFIAAPTLCTDWRHTWEGCGHDFGTSKSMWHPSSFLHGLPCCFPLSLDSFDHRVTKPWQLSGRHAHMTHLVMKATVDAAINCAASLCEAKGSTQQFPSVLCRELVFKATTVRGHIPPLPVEYSVPGDRSAAASQHRGWLKHWRW